MRIKKQQVVPFNKESGIEPKIQPVIIEGDTVRCYGEEKSFHPVVYLHLNKDGMIRCPYCSRLFVKKTAIKNSF